MQFRKVSSAQNANDHLAYRDFVNWESDLTGEATASINTSHYLMGMRMREGSSVPVTRLDVLTLNHRLWLRQRGDHLLWYFASSFRPNYLHTEYYEFLRNREPLDTPADFHIYPHEVAVLKARQKFLLGDLAAFDLAIKPNPTVAELEAFSLRKPCWSILFPVKSYLLDHADIAKQYRGLLPMGKDVVAYVNHFMQLQAPTTVVGSEDAE